MSFEGADVAYRLFCFLFCCLVVLFCVWLFGLFVLLFCSTRQSNNAEKKRHEKRKSKQTNTQAHTQDKLNRQSTNESENKREKQNSHGTKKQTHDKPCNETSTSLRRVRSPRVLLVSLPVCSSAQYLGRDGWAIQRCAAAAHCLGFVS